MTRYFLTKVAIEGFRGVNNEGDPLVLDFKSNAVNSVFGPNGLGKSSIFEALSYAIYGKIPKLEGLPAADAADNYYVNRFHTAKRATIDLIFRPDDGSPAIEIRVERSPTGTRSVSSPSGYGNPQQLLDSFATDTVLLDYKTFGQFVEDTPLQRGRTFSGLLGLGALSEFRQVLETLSHGKALKSDFGLETLEATRQGYDQQVSAALIKIRAAYKHLLGHDVSEPITYVGAAADASAALAQVPLLNPFISATTFEKVKFNDVRNAIKTSEGSDRRDRLAELLQEHGRLAALGPGDNEQAEQQELRTLLQQRDDAVVYTRGFLYQKLYEAAEKLLNEGDLNEPRKCPLCDSVDLSEPIATHVATHLTAYATVREAESKIRQKWPAHQWVVRFKALDTALTSPPEARQSGALDEAFRLATPSTAKLDEAVALLASLESARLTKIGALETEKQTLEKELPPSLVSLTEQVERAEQLQAGLADHKKFADLAAAVQARLDRRRRWCSFIEDASQEFADAEVALSTAHTLAIESDYRKLYEQVTRNPEIVPFLKKASGSEELHLRLAKFYGLTDLSASTLLQESYRNALAICIFLAAAQKSVVPARFIVLDDITSSFDNGHQFNLMELFRTVVAVPANPVGPQVIILSHDGSLEKYFDTLSNGSGWHHQKLQGAPPQGAVLIQPQDAQRLRTSAEKFFKAGQIQQGSPLLRQYLEYSLLQIIRKVGIPVPLDFSIRDDRKMVENCLIAINQGVELERKAGTLILEQAQQDALTKTLVPKILSNYVAHYATGSAASVSAHVLLGILSDIDDVVDCFRYTCKCSGSLPRRFYDGLSAKHCGC